MLFWPSAKNPSSDTVTTFSCFFRIYFSCDHFIGVLLVNGRGVKIVQSDPVSRRMTRSISLLEKKQLHIMQCKMYVLKKQNNIVQIPNYTDLHLRK